MFESLLNFWKGKDFLIQRYAEAPAVQFAIEMAFSGLESRHPLLHFDTPVINGHQTIPINGLIWMGDIESMMAQLEQKNTDVRRHTCAKSASEKKTDS